MNNIARYLSWLFLTCYVFASGTWVVRQDGAGPIQIGMTLAQLNAVLHERFKVPTQNDEQACFYVEPKGHDVAIMMEDGRVARIDVAAPGITTDSRVQVGDPESRVRNVYGDRLTVEPHQYFEEGHYLTVRSKDGRYAIRFETDGKKVTLFYGGTYRAIQYVEGCL